jgi:hypothetical protein
VKNVLYEIRRKVSTQSGKRVDCRSGVTIEFRQLESGRSGRRPKFPLANPPKRSSARQYGTRSGQIVHLEQRGACSTIATSHLHRVGAGNQIDHDCGVFTRFIDQTERTGAIECIK